MTITKQTGFEDESWWETDWNEILMCSMKTRGMNEKVPFLTFRNILIRVLYSRSMIIGHNLIIERMHM